MSQTRQKLSTVVPCYNEEECIDELYQRLTAVSAQAAGDDYEIVFVNDGSRDRTWDRVAEFAAKDSRVVGIDLSRNHGPQLALTAGLQICRGERIFIIDADLQDPPELLIQMMEIMDRGVDVVYGQRATRAGETWIKRTMAAMFYRVLRGLTDIEIPLDTGDFRLMNRRALDVLLSMPEQHRFVRGMVSWIGLTQQPLVYDRSERFAGVTKYPFRKMLNFAADAITGFSIRPLRLASHIGVGLGFFGLFLLGYTLYSWLFLKTVEGWASLMTVVVIIGSVQMFVLGLMGEYLGRVYMETKRRPLFVIREIVSARHAGGTVASAGESDQPTP